MGLADVQKRPRTKGKQGRKKKGGKKERKMEEGNLYTCTCLRFEMLCVCLSGLLWLKLSDPPKALQASERNGRGARYRLHIRQPMRAKREHELVCGLGRWP